MRFILEWNFGSNIKQGKKKPFLWTSIIYKIVHTVSINLENRFPPSLIALFSYPFKVCLECAIMDSVSTVPVCF